MELKSLTKMLRIRVVQIDLTGLMQTLLAAGGLYLFKQMTVGIDQLNVKLAVLCEKVYSHDNRIERLENRSDED